MARKTTPKHTLEVAPLLPPDEGEDAELDSARILGPLGLHSQLGMRDGSHHVPPASSSASRALAGPGVMDYLWEAEYPSGVVPPQEIPAMLGKLSPRQVTYGVARMWGWSQRQAASKVGAAAVTARAWERSPWWQALLVRERARAFGNKEAAFSPLVPLVLERFEAELRGEYGMDLAHDTAKYVADQVFGKATQVQINENHHEGELSDAFVQVVLQAAEANRRLEQLQRERATGITDAEVRELPPPEL